ncbi:sensor histidine kinase [Agrobacterium sp. Ap1]|nr:sensor histidine kinase [Agrobacterium sp. Ap1]
MRSKKSLSHSALQPHRCCGPGLAVCPDTFGSGQLEVRVSDGGRPIPLTDIDKLFMPFRRGGASTGNGMEGLGLDTSSLPRSPRGRGQYIREFG